ncbi:hypothetical protein [Undibacterium sp.]|uniref:hypothetical protein n=1 Tax=Undibacterium sp. TaxID=1914977 RepID=UPI00374DDC4D
MRQPSVVLAFLVTAIIFWSLAPHPGKGVLTLLSINHARVLYTSSALAVASAKLFGVLFGLLGFYLLRGRTALDMRSGVGAVIGSTGISNGALLLSRWLGGAGLLMLLALALMINAMVFQGLRGDGTIQPLVYLQTYCAFLLPVIFFAASCAVLFDSVGALMGKAGDLIYLVLWTAQFPMLDHFIAGGSKAFAPWMFFDISGAGMSLIMLSMKLGLPVSAISKGVSMYEPQLAAVSLPDALWPAAMFSTRLVSAGLAMLLLLPAIALFHRFSADVVKAGSTRRWSSPWAMLNRWSRPLSRLIRPWPQLAAALPGILGLAIADVALTLIAAPVALAALIILFVTATAVDIDRLPMLTVVAIAFWGILVSDVSVRDFQADTELMVLALPGGSLQRYWRQMIAASLLGLLLVLPISLRWAFQEPLRAAALLSGILSLSAMASLLGRCSHNARFFLVVFMLWLYVANNEPFAPMLDIVGFNGVANGASIFMQLGCAMFAALAGFAYHRLGRLSAR